MAPKTSEATEGKEERRREQNRLAQRRFRQRYNQRKAQVLPPQNIPSPSSESRNCTTFPDPSWSPSGPLSYHDTSLTDIDSIVFLDGLELTRSETHLAPVLGSNATGAGLQPTPPATESEVDILRPVPNNAPYTFPDNHICSEPATPNFGGSDLGKPYTSPLQKAVQMGNSKITKLLLKHNADCNERDSNGLSPLALAIIGGHEDVMDMLLSHGTRIGQVDNEHRSVLHWAVIHRRDRLLEKLLKHCAGESTLLNGCTKEGKTPLLIAIETGSEVAVEALLRSGASV